MLLGTAALSPGLPSSPLKFRVSQSSLGLFPVLARKLPRGTGVSQLLGIDLSWILPLSRAFNSSPPDAGWSLLLSHVPRQLVSLFPGDAHNLKHLSALAGREESLAPSALHGFLSPLKGRMVWTGPTYTFP